MKNISILGSTGSIGRNALQIVETFPQQFKIKALAAKTNTDLLAKQIEQFTPELAVVFDAASAQQLKQKLGASSKVEILYGDEGYQAAASDATVDIVLTAVVG
ncbi:MAG: 1-deoxy-D-xylulose-5-phosphate reductoisomerase, partial [Desulfobacterales bacterium]